MRTYLYSDDIFYKTSNSEADRIARLVDSHRKWGKKRRRLRLLALIFGRSKQKRRLEGAA